MIVPMRKLSLLVFYKDYQDFLEELRDRGVVHIHENKKRSAEDEELKQKLAVIKRIVEITKQLSKRVPKKEMSFTDMLERWSLAIEPKDKLAFYRQIFYPEEQLPEESEVTELDVLAFLEGQFKRMEQTVYRMPAGICAFLRFLTGNIYRNGKINTMLLLFIRIRGRSILSQCCLKMARNIRRPTVFSFRK